MFIRTAALCALAFATPGFAQTLTLSPADPQPDAAALAPGLAVSYAYPKDVRNLATAAKALKKAKPGPALAGFSYLDGADGEITMTSEKAAKVAAAITGFIKFEAAGTYTVEFISNDGILASIGGQKVAMYDEIHACESAGAVDVEVPEAGWYDVEATYFQRKGSACLLMDWGVDGDMEPVPDAAFAHLK